MTESNVKPIMGEEELEAALRLVQRIRLTANDGNPMYTNLEAAVLVHEYMKEFIERAVASARTEGAIWR